MGSEALVSVVVTCFNQGRYLRDSLDSLLRQSHRNWECLVINDGSSDDTERIALEYQKNDNRIRYFHQANQGVAKARNFGLRQCEGQFIQFLDADDLIHSDKMATQVGILESNDAVDIVYGSSRYFFDGQPEVLYPLHSNGSIPCDLTFRDKFQVEMLLKHNICTNCSALLRKAVIEKVKFRKVIFEDWVFNLESALNGFVFHFDSSLSSYSYIRMTESSQMMKHGSQISQIEQFDSILFGLVEEYRYDLEQKLVLFPPSGWSSKIKSFFRQLTPPIIYSLAAYLKRKRRF